MLEGPYFYLCWKKNFRFEAVADRCPVPVAHLTVRAQSGIQLRVSQRKRPSTKQILQWPDLQLGDTIGNSLLYLKAEAVK